ncbi:hypothetical protein SBA4_1050016 [Candidatus Sulfopaludibacter sp. SbA4]|nr:hypothetical protein SBA4_1050016 [Candidatus Sulfopaludibacter sp. SbA4]
MVFEVNSARKSAAPESVDSAAAVAAPAVVEVPVVLEALVAAVRARVMVETGCATGLTVEVT